MKTHLTVMKAVHSAILFAVTALIVNCNSLNAAADNNPPERMTYQSYLVDANGQALGKDAPKNYDVIFRIYNDQSGGSKLWTEQQTVTVDNGNFSILLGEGTQVGSDAKPTLSTLFTNADASDRFIEMTVKGIGSGGSDVTILPRLRLMTGPYAFLARHAVNAANAAKLVNSLNASVVTISGTSVGINQATPNAALDINGNVKSTGLTVAGTANVTGAANAGSLMVTNNANIAGTANVKILTVTNNASVGTTLTVGSTLTVAGAATANSFVGYGTVPLGGIIMWSGSTAPAGWALCNGQTVNSRKTPDLRGRFVVSYNDASWANGLTTRTIDQSGGEEKHKLSIDEMPSHNHRWQYGWEGDDSGGGGSYAEWTHAPGWSDAPIGYRGGDQPHNTMPPFYVLAFIMRVY